MPISDIIRAAVVTVDPDATVVDLARLLRTETVGSALVVEDGEPIGIVTDRDVAVRVVGHSRDPTGVTVREVMTADPFSVAPDAGIFEVVDAMCERTVRRVPVVEDGRLVGIVTLDDLLRLLADEFGRLAEVVEAESPS